MTYNKNYQVDSAEVYCSIHSVANADGGISNFVLAALSNGEVIPECFFAGPNNRTNLYSEDSININTSYSQKIAIDKGYLLHIVYWGNFYHFMIEFFPNLYYYSKNLMQHDVKVILPARNMLIDDLLQILNIPDELVVTLEKDTLCTVDELHYSSTTSSPGNTNSQIEAFKYLQNQLSYVDSDCSSANLYLSRNDNCDHRFNNSANGMDRSIINEDKVLSLVKNFGYKIDTVGTKTFREKAQLLSRTKNIVTPHGGNILNCCLAKNLESLTILTCKYAKFCDDIFTRFIQALLPAVEITLIKGHQPQNPDGKLVYAKIPFEVEINQLEESLQNEYDTQI
jgi:hypothetical protein